MPKPYLTVYVRKFRPEVTVDGLTPAHMYAYARHFI